MVRKSFMVIAGETSGDMLAAELIPLLSRRLTDIESTPTEFQQPLRASLEPEFYGAGGPRMAAAGVQLAFDMTQHAVVGFWEVIRHYRKFRQLFHQLLQLAIEREPHAIICVDFSGFNLRFAHAVRNHVRALQGTFGNWNPRMIQYVSPQVWASRPERAQRLARDFDLLLSIFPFEEEWYARNTPGFPVEFVGHPLVDRFGSIPSVSADGRSGGTLDPSVTRILLLPGSRVGELKRHLPVMLGALSRIRSAKPGVHTRMTLPNEDLARLARQYPLPADLEIQVGDLAKQLPGIDLAIASTGTVTLECAYFGVPTVALYKTSRPTYWIGKQLVHVKFLAMPNLLAGEEIYPEFIQDDATPEKLAQAALALLNDQTRRVRLKIRLGQIRQGLGAPGASARAAAAIVRLVMNHPGSIRAALTA
jgi:lipid-A-disaccharide synthase